MSMRPVFVLFFVAAAAALVAAQAALADDNGSRGDASGVVFR